MRRRTSRRPRKIRAAGLVIAAAILACAGATFGQVPGRVPLPGRVVVTPPGLQALDLTRYTGPFCPGELGSIKLQLEGTDATWYYGRFVGGHPSWTFILRYFPAAFTIDIVPADIPPQPQQAPRHVPGTYRSNDGINDMRFALSCVRYRSRYGGSIELLFRSEETTEYDARAGDILWDLENVELSLFIVPRYGQFNIPVSGILGREPISLEMRPGAMTAYTISQLGEITVEADPHRAEFDALWSTVADAIRTRTTGKFRISASAFVYGFIHQLFQTFLTGTNKVAMMELADDRIALTFGTAVTTVSMSAKVVAGEFSTNVIRQGVEVDVNLTSSWNPSLTNGKRFDLVENSDTPWKLYFSFPLSDCLAVPSPSFSVGGTIREMFPLGYVVETAFQHPAMGRLFCQNLQTAATAGQWGAQQTQDFPVNLTDSGGSPVVPFTIQVQTFLAAR